MGLSGRLRSPHPFSLRWRHAAGRWGEGSATGVGSQRKLHIWSLHLPPRSIELAPLPLGRTLHSTKISYHNS